jgi:hypothetical protein
MPLKTTPRPLTAAPAPGGSAPEFPAGAVSPGVPTARTAAEELVTVISRHALFEAAWTWPLTELAVDLGLIDVGLRKMCDRRHPDAGPRGFC